MLNKSEFEKLNTGTSVIPGTDGVSRLSDFAGLVCSEYGDLVQSVLAKKNPKLHQRLVKEVAYTTVSQVEAIMDDLYEAYSVLSQAGKSDSDLLGI